MDSVIKCDDGTELKLVDSDRVDFESDVRPPSVVERYFARRYAVTSGKTEDVCVMRHSNGIFVVTLSERHEVVSGNEKIEKVEVRPDFHEPRGKRKRHGTFVQRDTTLCTIFTESKEYKIKAHVRGVLLELNAQLETSPELVREDCYENGFIAVILSKSSNQNDGFDELISYTDYHSSAGIDRDREQTSSANAAQDIPKSTPPGDETEVSTIAKIEKTTEVSERAPQEDQGASQTVAKTPNNQP